MKLAKLLASCLLVTPAFLPGTSAFALTEEAATNLVRSSKNVGEAYRQAAVVHVAGNTISIQLYKDKRAAENDMKIDSILLAKTLMDADPAAIASVRIYFYETPTSFYVVEVGKTDITSFGRSDVNREEMLASIHMRHEAITLRLDDLLKQGVPDGPGLTLRSNFLARLEYLRKRYGVNLDEYAGRLAFINRDAAAKKLSERAIEDRVVELSTRLDAYVRRYNEHIEAENAKIAAKNKARDPNPALIEKHTTGSTRVSGEDYKRLAITYPYFAASTSGARYPERYAIGYRLMQLKQSGQDVSGYKPLFAKMEAASLQTDEPNKKELAQVIELLRRRLRVNPPPEAKKP